MFAREIKIIIHDFENHYSFQMYIIIYNEIVMLVGAKMTNSDKVLILCITYNIFAKHCI